MDAVEFFKEKIRMRNSFEGCFGCPLEPDCTDADPELMVKAVEDWSQAHPKKTIMDDFFEKHPNAPKEKDGTPINICPSDCGYIDEPNSLSICEKFNNNCLKCWSRPMEE